MTTIELTPVDELEDVLGKDVPCTGYLLNKGRVCGEPAVARIVFHCSCGDRATEFLCSHCLNELKQGRVCCVSCKRITGPDNWKYL